MEIITRLKERITTLEQQQAKDSHNRSLPPSSDRFVRPPKSLRSKSEKKAGGQPGHQGHHLMRTQTPDQTIVHTVSHCEHCQQDVREQAGKIGERRQVIDLPPKRVWVSEHQIEQKCCPRCAHTTQASFPASVRATAQYGVGIQALAVYLVEGQLLPYGRASEVLRDVLGIQLSAGSLSTFVARCHERLAHVEPLIKDALIESAVIHQDETSLSVTQEHHWVHVCSTERLTHYGSHRKRGREAMDAIGIAPVFTGTSVHDAWVSYKGYGYCHACCNVHHLRELTFFDEEEGQLWARLLAALLLEMKIRVEQAKAAGPSRLDASVLAPLLCRYDQILLQGYLFNQAQPPPHRPARPRRKQSPACNLLDRLFLGKEAVLTFLHDFTVPFSNDVIAYCTPSAWLACVWIFVSAFVRSVLIRRRKDRNSLIIGTIHGD
jgi:transposase